MISSRNNQVANERLRTEIRIKQNMNNLIDNRDRLKSYVDRTITPALKSRLQNELYQINKKLDDSFFNLHILNKTNNLI
jgi:hypothetical protein